MFLDKVNSLSSAISVVDMHTGGEPVRIIHSGYPNISGDSILDKRRFVTQQLDHLRHLLMLEPRGHTEMYGALLVPPSLANADLAVLFLHNQGYSTMCGHAVIALARYALDYGLVKRVDPITTVNIECPCGLVPVQLDVNSGQAWFDSVPAFLFAQALSVNVPNYGQIHCDISYGGAFYALASAAQFGLDVHHSSVAELTQAGWALTQAVQATIPLSHPDHDDLAFLYGSILDDGRQLGQDGPSRNICIFAEAQVDRSPTGSGVTARMAARFAKGQVQVGEQAEFESITGARFHSQIQQVLGTQGSFPSVSVRVAGKGYYCGESRFILEADDTIGRGFLLR